jgi:serine/threonine protein kinase
MNEFEEKYKLLKDAKIPEDVFGNSKEMKHEDITKTFNKIVVHVHPDKCEKENIEKANEAFLILMNFRTNAEQKIIDGIYGEKNPYEGVIISTRKNKYKIVNFLTEGDLCYVFKATDKNGMYVAIKIIKNVVNNDLLENEATNLKYLYNDSPVKTFKIMEHICPMPMDEFIYDDSGINRKGLVYPFIRGVVTVEDVINSYPNGIDVRDAAWMINRILGGLMAPHQSDLVHGGIVPNNIFLDLPTHNGIILDWAFSVKKETPLKAVSTKYKMYYPDEVFSKTPVNSGLDLYMVAKIFIKLVGGDVIKNEFPNTVPANICGLFRACLLGKKHRTIDAYELHSEFSDALKANYGSRKFRKFELNK